ncbi:hypothetical protein DR999_PMT20604 [Platysternon megacephalum]|uniref:Uncharacterized protein n=1 Tax=Platysternon megacephalum TaxID=55544 RepID=A0A4D9DRR0_9SAUR|nr:hypothetical protein DR999_PMT20604 [Platysternon megacephalum]
MLFPEVLEQSGWGWEPVISGTPSTLDPTRPGAVGFHYSSPENSPSLLGTWKGLSHPQACLRKQLQYERWLCSPALDLPTLLIDGPCLPVLSSPPNPSHSQCSPLHQVCQWLPSTSAEPVLLRQRPSAPSKVPAWLTGWRGRPSSAAVELLLWVCTLPLQLPKLAGLRQERQSEGCRHTQLGALHTKEPALRAPTPSLPHANSQPSMLQAAPSSSV